jgi:hypothetical protein
LTFTEFAFTALSQDKIADEIAFFVLHPRHPFPQTWRAAGTRIGPATNAAGAANRPRSRR